MNRDHRVPVKRFPMVACDRSFISSSSSSSGFFGVSYIFGGVVKMLLCVAVSCNETLGNAWQARRGTISREGHASVIHSQFKSSSARREISQSLSVDLGRTQSIVEGKSTVVRGQ